MSRRSPCPVQKVTVVLAAVVALGASSRPAAAQCAGGAGAQTGLASVSCEGVPSWSGSVAYGEGAPVAYNGCRYTANSPIGANPAWAPGTAGLYLYGNGAPCPTAGCNYGADGLCGTAGARTAMERPASQATARPTASTVPRAAVTPAPGSTPTRTATATSTSPPKQLVTYYANWNSYPARNFLVKNIDTIGAASKLTRIHYAFSDANASGQCGSIDTYADWDKAYDAALSVSGVADTWEPGVLRGNFNQLKQLKARYPALKAVMSIGGWRLSSHFTKIAATAAGRQAFAADCIDKWIKGNISATVAPANMVGVFDGLDIDWEYPGACGNTCAFSSADTQNFTALLAELRRQLNAYKPGLLLTIAAPARPDKLGLIELDGIAPYVDAVNLMTYDFHGAWEGHTNHHSALYPASGDPDAAQNYSGDYAVTRTIAGGVPASKILLGIGFFGRGWSGVTNVNNGLYQTATGPAPCTAYAGCTAGIEDYKVVSALGGRTAYRQSDSKAYWTFDGSEFWSYDDPTAVAAKMAYVKSKGLGGSFSWDISGDTATATLTSAMKSGMQ